MVHPHIVVGCYLGQLFEFSLNLLDWIILQFILKYKIARVDFYISQFGTISVLLPKITSFRKNETLQKISFLQVGKFLFDWFLDSYSMQLKRSKWDSIAFQVSSHGPERSVEQCRKKLSDMKSLTKSKVAR